MEKNTWFPRLILLGLAVVMAAAAQGTRVRALLDRTEKDLQQSRDSLSDLGKNVESYDVAVHDLGDFREELGRGYLNEDKLDEVIDDIGDLIDNHAPPPAMEHRLNDDLRDFRLERVRHFE